MGRFKTVPSNTKDERFASHVESELADISRRTFSKGTAVGTGVITSANMASVKLKDVAIQTTLTKIPHGLGAVPSEYNVIVKKPTATSYKATYQVYAGATKVYHGLGVEPKFVVLGPFYNGTVCTDVRLWESYIGNTEYIHFQGLLGGAWSTTNLIIDVFISAGSTNWTQTQEPDSVYLYLKADDVTLTVDIIVKE